MKRNFLLSLSLLVLAVGGVPGVAQAMPRGSFLTRPVSSPQALANLVLSNPEVAARYSKHFGMDARKLATYFRTNLHMSTLSRSEPLEVSYYGYNDVIVSRTKRLPAGTPVFVDFTGKPILEASCGNPLTSVLTERAAEVQPKTLPTASVPSQIPGAVQVAQVVTPEPTPQLQANFAPPPPPVTEVMSSLSVLAAPVAAVVPALLGATAVYNSKTVAIVPEPSSLLAMGLGMATLMAGCLRHPRSKKMS